MEDNKENQPSTTTSKNQSKNKLSVEKEQFLEDDKENMPNTNNASKKNVSVKKEQYEKMREFHEEHDKTMLEPSEFKKLWNGLAVELNDLGPPVHTVQKWKTKWRVRKSYEKRRDLKKQRLDLSVSIDSNQSNEPKKRRMDDGNQLNEAKKPRFETKHSDGNQYNEAKTPPLDSSSVHAGDSDNDQPSDEEIDFKSQVLKKIDGLATEIKIGLHKLSSKVDLIIENQWK